MAEKTKKRPKTRKKASPPKPAPVRRKYDLTTKEEAKDLYLRGLPLDRISKYLQVPARTLTNWQTDDRWTEAKDPAAAAVELKARGYRVPDIAARLEVSEKTIRQWLKAASNATAPK